MMKRSHAVDGTGNRAAGQYGRGLKAELRMRGVSAIEFEMQLLSVHDHVSE